MTTIAATASAIVQCDRLRVVARASCSHSPGLYWFDDGFELEDSPGPGPLITDVLIVAAAGCRRGFSVAEKRGLQQAGSSMSSHHTYELSPLRSFGAGRLIGADRAFHVNWRTVA